MYIILYSIRKWILSIMFCEKTTILFYYLIWSALIVKIARSRLKKINKKKQFPCEISCLCFKDKQDVALSAIFLDPVLPASVVSIQFSSQLLHTASSYPFPAMMTPQMKDIQKGKN